MTIRKSIRLLKLPFIRALLLFLIILILQLTDQFSVLRFGILVITYSSVEWIITETEVDVKTGNWIIDRGGIVFIAATILLILFSI
ncbi:hypothetical protein NCCP2716_28390 [Sporosarcina sp. NCCP-2716]|uniref:hypothetical protein n=1 Tax=Sporosarcina sp. NCCP-2716 TaxID=2943679 RepID=UPI00203F0896|nr:hypothetical protein [Sporosarcina sp. NCCP-2716]GKV70341.1 hypothetical protein NCCP2716_28390 [Sporosarcina sp. NCCP-2716]